MDFKKIFSRVNLFKKGRENVAPAPIEEFKLSEPLETKIKNKANYSRSKPFGRPGRRSSRKLMQGMVGKI